MLQTIALGSDLIQPFLSWMPRPERVLVEPDTHKHAEGILLKQPQFDPAIIEPDTHRYAEGITHKPHDPMRRALGFFPLTFFPVIFISTIKAPARIRPQVFGGSICVFGCVTYYMFLSDNG